MAWWRAITCFIDIVCGKQRPVVWYSSSGLWNFCSVAKMPMPDIAADIVPMPMVFSERTENELACKCAVLSATNTPTSI